MSIVRNILAIIFTFSLMIILLISSVDIVAYHIPGYYRYEYTKYSSHDRVGMDMDELLRVSGEMMAYLKGKRESLSDISAKIKNQPDVLFFNEKEAAHMKDVRELFIAAIFIRRILLAICILIPAIIKFSRGSLRKVMPKNLLAGSCIFLTLLLCVGGIIASNFSKYFVVFHHIFFNNDLWILDPATDNLINIVPEGFFLDTARNIAAIYLIFVVGIIVFSTVLIRHSAK
ncbi:integral membrane protein [Johnsonella ignava ATCC 51276]|uniref:Integral membrane protein n=1 Tax=Johnsonella ignava ATCC 51276 TaxID=679200 RepID=G5GJA6_9FIRM|nr:TIGR01906 family membrane protein [Johnsonella ignava]EHI55231.1 integral membrane protein [Johnsonella ignava ATCC 51276]